MAEVGGKTTLEDENTIVLQAGHVYFMSYTFNAAPGVGNYIQILPYFNTFPQFIYSTTASNSTPDSNGVVSVSSSFIVLAARTDTVRVRFAITSNSTDYLDLSGAVSIFTLTN